MDDVKTAIVIDKNEKEEKKRRKNKRRIERETTGCLLPLYFPLDAL